MHMQTPYNMEPVKGKFVGQLIFIPKYDRNEAYIWVNGISYGSTWSMKE
jgi:hypothetical protein